MNTIININVTSVIDIINIIIIIIVMIIIIIIIIAIIIVFCRSLLPSWRRSTKSQVRSASVKDAATITDSRSATVKD